MAMAMGAGTYICTLVYLVSDLLSGCWTHFSFFPPEGPERNEGGTRGSRVWKVSVWGRPRPKP